MTSKEELELLKQRIICAKGKEEFNLLYKKYCDYIERDLEILELLKERIKKDIFGRLQYVSKPTLNEQTHIMLDQDEEKIRLWLEEEE